MLDELELTGRARTHITQLDDPRCGLHHDVVAPFLALRARAAESGIDLQPYSSFRDFDTQVLIWNRKFRGERTLFDRAGEVLDPSSLTDLQKMTAILAWSALPGASRHHWGTEIDVIDRAAVPEDYRVELLPAEFAENGVFNSLADWLDSHLESHGFFRPYDRDRGGVSREPWHISYAAVSLPAQSALTLDVVTRAIETSGLSGLELVLNSLPGILRQFVANVAQPSATVLARSAVNPAA
jgi:LAS superfamily LD-carboxypeptidase LdcB